MTTLQPVPCYFCQGVIRMEHGVYWHWAVCDKTDCKTHGPSAPTRDKAVQRWNELGERMATLTAGFPELQAAGERLQESGAAFGLTDSDDYHKIPTMIRALTAEVARLRGIETAAREALNTPPTRCDGYSRCCDTYYRASQFDALKAALSVSKGEIVDGASPAIEMEQSFEDALHYGTGFTMMTEDGPKRIDPKDIYKAPSTPESGGADTLDTVEGMAAGPSDTSGGVAA